MTSGQWGLCALQRPHISMSKSRWCPLPGGTRGLEATNVQRGQESHLLPSPTWSPRAGRPVAASSVLVSLVIPGSPSPTLKPPAGSPASTYPTPATIFRWRVIPPRLSTQLSMWLPKPPLCPSLCSLLYSYYFPQYPPHSLSEG